MKIKVSSMVLGVFLLPAFLFLTELTYAGTGICTCTDRTEHCLSGVQAGINYCKRICNGDTGATFEVKTCTPKSGMGVW